jgi:hypothetical protein
MTLQDIKEAGQFTANTSHLSRMCSRIWRQPGQVYEIAQEYGTPFVADSYMRETIFSYIADKYYGGDYDKIYSRWLSTAI